MPIYAYRCDACGHSLDALQKISDPQLTDCPACGKSMLRKQLTAAGFQLKGSGWYVTDFRGDGKPKKDSAEAADGAPKPADATAAEGAKAEARADTKAEPKSDAKAGAPSDAKAAPATSPAPAPAPAASPPPSSSS